VTFDPAVKILFGFQLFDDGFDDPITIRHPMKVVSEVSGPNSGPQGILVQRRWFGGHGRCQSFVYQRIGFFGRVRVRDIQEQDVHAAIGKVTSQPGAHNSGTQDSNFMEISIHNTRWMVAVL
jgi:hypothetical protein